MAQTTQPTILVIFGITGDLAQRYLLPSLANVQKNGQLPADFKLLGVSRRQLAVDDVLTKSCRHLADLLELFQMDMVDQDSYEKLQAEIDAIGSAFKSGFQVIFYFAVPPAAVLPIIRRLGKVKFGQPIKLLLEKPFGVDYASAEELIKETNKYFKEDQVYRIDHYLAKEMAQNIAVFIGANALFRDVWNNRFIESIEIIASESIGIEDRAAFYEQTGALRDFVQSHLMQLAALVLMKPCPDVFDFSEVPRRRLAALTRLKLARPGAVVRGQYQGYRQEVDNPGSTIETFVALKLESGDPAWQGVPVSLITGKRLEAKFTEIRVHFKKTRAHEANLLCLRIQPREGIELDLWVKKPGYDQDLEKLPLSFSYEQYFGANQPEAYEQVLVDALRGTQNLFAGSGEILASWKVLDPILHNWAMDSSDLIVYKTGSSYQHVLQAARPD